MCGFGLSSSAQRISVFWSAERIWLALIVSTSGAGNVLSECGTLPSPPDRRLCRRQLRIVATLDDASIIAKFGFDPLARLLGHRTL